HVAGKIVEREARHRPAARARPARLRPKHPEARSGDPRRDFVVVLRIAAARRQEYDEGSCSFRDDLDARVAADDDAARALRARQGDAYSAPGRRRARMRKRSSTPFFTAIAPPRRE